MKFVLTVLAILLTLGRPVPAHAQATLLNASYDPTRELYRAFNEAFARHWAAKSGGQKVSIRQSPTAASSSVSGDQ